ncbi:MAG TPA: hypothetical protein VL727_27205 [Puia sp.]|jgi:hypothetical protein|nr:hypothetical protein [Puia sp.]
MNTKVVKAIAVAMTSIVLLGNPFTSKANGGSNGKTSLTEEQVSVKYQGTKGNSIVFKVEFTNPTAEKFSLIIKNDNGDVVYSQQFTDANFAKTVTFENTDAEMHPVFIIRSAGNSEIVRQFSVSKTVTESTVVTRL